MFRPVLVCVNMKLVGTVHAMLYVIVCMCAIVCISTNSVDERGECIHPSSTTPPTPQTIGLTRVFFCAPLIFFLFLSDTVLMYMYLDVFLYLQSPLFFGQVNVYCALLIVRIKRKNNITSHARVTTCACSRVDAMGHSNYVEQNTLWAD